MRNIPVPTVNDNAIFDKIILQKYKPHKSILEKIKPTVKDSYKKYLSNSSNLEKLKPQRIDDSSKKSLIHAFSSKTKSMQEQCETLFDPESLYDFDECPFCGIGEPTTLDHYLPKEKFPEFAVFSKNLIPVCSACNSKYKGEKFLDKGERLFIHSYYDKIPDFDFIQVKVSIASKVELEYFINSDPHNKYFSNIISNHFNTLHLERRYKRRAIAEISRKKETLQRIFDKNKSYHNVSKVLLEEAKTYRREMGSGNYWKVALYESLANSVEFCNEGFLKEIKK